MTKIIPGLFGFISVIIFIRLLGVEEFGLFSLKFLFIQISSFFCFGWLKQALLRYYGRLIQTPDISGIIFSGVVITIIANVFVVFLLYLCQFPLKFSFIPVILLTIAINLVSLADVLFMTQENPVKVAQLSLVQSILSILFPLLLIILVSPSHTSVINGLIIAYSITAFIFLLLQLKQYNPVLKILLPTKNQFEKLRPLFRFGWPLSFWFATSASLRFLDRYFIEYYLGSATMGSYAGIAEIINKLFTVLLFPIVIALHPRIMNLWNRQKFRHALTLLRIAMIVQFLLFLGILLFYIIFKADIVPILIKLIPELPPEISNIIFPIIIGGFLWQFALLVQKPLEITERPRIMLLFMVIALIFNIAGNILFIPKIGILATAWTFVATGSIYIILNIIVSFKFLINRQSL